VAWLLDVVPADYRLYGVLRRYPLALAAMAAHHANACVAGARGGYRTARTELGDALPPHGLDALLATYRAEGRRLVGIARAVNLVGRALRGEEFSPQLADATHQDPAGATERAEATDTAGATDAAGEQAAAKEAADPQTPSGEAAGKQAPGKQTAGKAAPGKRTRAKEGSAPATQRPARRAS